MERRQFLQTSAGVLTAASFSRIAGAADRIRVGLIGSGGRGQYLGGIFKELGADVAAVCDVYEPRLQEGLKLASTGAKGYEDYRKLLDDKSLDAVIIATPDHWHSRMAVDAAGAGKDIYLEKPMAHTIDEGFAIVDAVRRAKRVAQVGTQRRSSDFFQQAKAVMDSGKLGEVRLVTSQWMNSQTSLSAAKLEGALNWKAWLGNAPARPLDPVRFFNWYYFYDYCGGMLVGQAAHIADAIQWFMNSNGPSAVTCVGGRPNIPGAEVPETTSLTMEFPENYLATFVVGYKAMRYHRFNDQLKQFHGSAARFDVGREWFNLYPQTKEMDLTASLSKRDPGAFARADHQHVQNFLDCVRSRKEPNAPVEVGQATNIVCCMAVQSMRTGRRLVWNAAARRVKG
jgi:predicted dehydrogenase